MAVLGVEKRQDIIISRCRYTWNNTRAHIPTQQLAAQWPTPPDRTGEAGEPSKCLENKKKTCYHNLTKG